MPPETIQFALKGFEVGDEHKPLPEEDQNPVLEGGFLKGDGVSAPALRVTTVRCAPRNESAIGDDRRGGFMANSNPDA